MKLIKLSQGYFAKVDDEDFALVSKFKWSVLIAPNGRRYAVKGNWNGGRQFLDMMHRFILGLTPRKLNHIDVDHEDHDGLNCQRYNLRQSTRSQNNANQRKTRGTSKYKGVSWNTHANKWLAQIKLDGKIQYLGIFSDEEEAARAYDSAARLKFKEFANLNFGGTL